MKNNTKVAFMASGGGTNMQAIIDACVTGELAAEPCLVISNNAGSGALERARVAGIKALHMSSRTHADPDKLDAAMLEILQEQQIELLLLAGYMKKLGSRVLGYYRGRILNVHPSLLPCYGGQGMYGNNVHAAVLEAGETESGATIHIVDEEYDQGPVLAQSKVVVLPGDTIESLASRVLKVEHRLYVETLGRILNKEITLPG